MCPESLHPMPHSRMMSALNDRQTHSTNVIGGTMRDIPSLSAPLSLTFFCGTRPLSMCWGRNFSTISWYLSLCFYCRTLTKERKYIYKHYYIYQRLSFLPFSLNSWHFFAKESDVPQLSSLKMTRFASVIKKYHFL